MRPILSGLIATLFAAPALAATAPAAPPTVGPLSLDSFYNGVWYEQARTPTSLTRGCEYATTEHGRDEKGRVTVRDACRQDGAQGKLREISGIGEVLDPGRNAELKVRYRFGPFKPTRTYRIVAAAPDGAWHISAEPKFDKIYVFTRAVAPPRAEVEALVARVRALGYAGEVEIMRTPGRD